MEQMMITISVEEYKKLLSMQVRYEMLKDMARTEDYISLGDVRKILCVKYEGKEE